MIVATRVAGVVMVAVICACSDRDGSNNLESEATTSFGSTDAQDSSGFDDGYEVDGGGDGCAFACPDDPPPSGGGGAFCDTWSQDCAPGLKCMPWANDGGGSWNATRCSPLDPLPALVGAPCTVEGSGVSGIDDCELGSMCWGVDPETNIGTCVALCLGSESSPLCTDPLLTCVIAKEGVLALCLPVCDPLEPNCRAGEGCYPVDGMPVCMEDVGGDAGAYGEHCEYLDVCDPGLHCGEAVTPECMSCCTAYCDLDDPDPDASCPDVAVGQVCLPFFRNGQAPPHLQHVGACAMPD